MLALNGCLLTTVLKRPKPPNEACGRVAAGMGSMILLKPQKSNPYVKRDDADFACFRHCAGKIIPTFSCKGQRIINSRELPNCKELSILMEFWVLRAYMLLRNGGI